MKKLFLTGLLAAGLCCAAENAKQNDFTVIRERWLKAGQPQTPAEQNSNIGMANQLFGKLKPDGSIPGVNYATEKVNRANWPALRHWLLIKEALKAYRFGVFLDKNGKPMKIWGKNPKGDPGCKQDIVRALDHWAEKGYTMQENWWYQSIGVPNLFFEVYRLFGGEMPQETIAKFRPILDRSRVDNLTGANRSATAEIMVRKGMLYEDPVLMKNGLEILTESLEITPRQEGFQPDYSFHQHGPMLQFGNYGLENFRRYALWAHCLQGTGYALSAEKAALLKQYYLQGLRWVIFRGQMDLRSCGRQTWLNYGDKGQEILKAAKNFPDPEVAHAPEPEGAKYFYDSDYLIFRSKDFFFSGSLISRRTLGQECFPGENIQCRYQTLAATYSVTGKEYRNILPLWDWHRLPGTTALANDRGPSAKSVLNRSGCVGGVSDGSHAGAMMVFDGKNIDLKFRKEIFCFPGSGAVLQHTWKISSKAGGMVVTTVDSAFYESPVKVTAADGKETILAQDGKSRFAKVREIVHGGKKYHFPTPADLTVAIESKKANWRTVYFYPNRVVEGRIVSIYCEHGINPADGECTFVTLPAAQTVPELKIRPDAKGNYIVSAPACGITYAAMYAPGTAAAGKRSLETPQSLMVLFSGAKTFLSDPEQKVRALLKGKSDGRPFSVRLPDDQCGIGSTLCLQTAPSAAAAAPLPALKAFPPEPKLPAGAKLIRRLSPKQDSWCWANANPPSYRRSGTESGCLIEMTGEIPACGGMRIDGLPVGKYILTMPVSVNCLHRDFPSVQLARAPWTAFGSVSFRLKPGEAGYLIIPFTIPANAAQQSIRVPRMDFSGYPGSKYRFGECRIYRLD